tara:strand:- start:730 stop:972 length:243 start_codon:yes stop_codon:yes gene_type:complete
MGKLKKDGLTSKQRKELQAIIDSITKEAKDMVDDYSKNPSELVSGSIVQIHEGSPYVASREERLKSLTEDFGKDTEPDDN